MSEEKAAQGGEAVEIVVESVATGGEPDADIRAVVVESIKEGLTNNGVVNGTWLTTLHSSYVSRYQTDIDRTWTTATWLVALAWTLFPAAVAFNQRLTLEVVIIFGTTSVALVSLWLLIASVHQVWASRSYDIVRAIERLVLGATADTKLRTELKERSGKPWWLGRRPMQVIRLLFLAGTVAGWVWLGIEVNSGEFPPPELTPTPTPAG
ncbi:hypothetical protein [Agromyces humi]|uniref:hypothetical protein n=1 Tax=Agromyces humi TaxID=1766800 RepID=UPI00135A8BEA|nr:hypothetical protein [Agromyces humi]